MPVANAQEGTQTPKHTQDTNIAWSQPQTSKAGSTLRSSRAVPHPSTNRALRRLTSEVGRGPVHSTRYGRQRRTTQHNASKGRTDQPHDTHTGDTLRTTRSARCAPGTRPAQGRSLERANQYRCPKGLEVSVLVRLHLNGKQYRWRPYRVECTGSLPTSEVKRRRARLVLGWGTAREDLRVLPAFPQGPQGML